MDTFGSHSKTAEELLAEFDRIQNTKQEKLPVSTEVMRKRKLDPHETLRNDQRRWRHYSWYLYGVVGLTHALMWYAKDMSTSLGQLSRWVILDDMKKLPYSETNVLLGTVHPEVLDALLCGDFMYRYYHDPAFEAIVHSYHDLDVTPGIYVNYICMKKHKGGSIQADAGKSLSTNQLRKVLNQVMLYFNHQGAGSDEYAKRCDEVWPSANKDERNIDWDDGARRYYLKDDIHERWCKEVKRLLGRDALMTANERDMPLTSCFAEVGFGQNCASRAADHATNKATNSLFGLVHSIVELEWPGEFEVKAYQIFRITDKAQGKLSELVGSLICDSFWFTGGLNPMLSGNVDLAKTHLPSLMDRNRAILNKGTFLEDNFAASDRKLTRAKELFEYVKQAKALREADDQEMDALHKSLLALEVDAARLDQLHALVELKKLEMAWFKQREEQGLYPFESFIP